MKRLTGFIEKTIPWQKDLYGALQDFENALENVGNVKDFLQEENLIVGTVRYGLQNAKIEIVGAVENEQSSTIILRGKSDDFGNKGAEKAIDRVIETANRIVTGAALETSLVKRRTGMSFKKIALMLVGVVLLIIAISGGLRGSIEGTYRWSGSGHAASYTLKSDNRIIYESDGFGFGAMHREGTYTIDKEKTYIKTQFNDGLPPFQIKLEKGSNKWLLKSGQTVYEK